MGLPSSPCARSIRQRPRGFTLVELLVVISIIALLVSVLLPGLGSSRRRAREVVCSSNLHQLNLAFSSYAANHRDMIPAVGAFSHQSQQLYMIYQRASSTVTPLGFQNFGALIVEGYLPYNTPVYWCPLQAMEAHTDPRGNLAHLNLYTGVELLPSDAGKYAWVPARSGYLRRLTPLASRTMPERMSTLGSQAFVADVFSQPVRVINSHGNSVNVLHASGQVVRRSLVPYAADSPLIAALDAPINSSFNANIETIWQYLEK